MIEIKYRQEGEVRNGVIKGTGREVPFLHGIHRGTLTSRDTAMPTIHDSADEVLRELAQARLDYARMGAQIWFAYMYDDQGKRTDLTNHGLRGDHGPTANAK